MLPTTPTTFFQGTNVELHWIEVWNHPAMDGSLIAKKLCFWTWIPYSPVFLKWKIHTHKTKLAKGCQRWMYIYICIYGVPKRCPSRIYIYMSHISWGPLSHVAFERFRWSWWRKPPGTTHSMEPVVEPCEQETRKSYIQHVGVSKNRGKTPQNRWFIIENPIRNGWFEGTTIFGNPHIRSYHC